MSSLEKMDKEIIELETRIEDLRAKLQNNPDSERLALALDKCYAREAVIKARYCRAFVRSITIL